MKKGDIVEIFADPLTCEVTEGMAELVEYISSGVYCETWMVKFDDESPVCRRQVNIQIH